jgi:hypothetical protein
MLCNNNTFVIICVVRQSGVAVKLVNAQRDKRVTLKVTGGKHGRLNDS